LTFRSSFTYAGVNMFPWCTKKWDQFTYPGNRARCYLNLLDSSSYTISSCTSHIHARGSVWRGCES
jgi:hypothetical protein